MRTHAKKGYNHNNNAGEADQTILIWPNLQLLNKHQKKIIIKRKKGLKKGSTSIKSENEYKIYIISILRFIFGTVNDNHHYVR